MHFQSNLNDERNFSGPWRVSQNCIPHQHVGKTCHVISHNAMSGIPSRRFYSLLHSLNCRHLRAVRVVKGDCRWPLNTVEISTDHPSPQFITGEDFPSLYLCQPVTQPATQPTGENVSYLTDSLTSNMLELWDSLDMIRAWNSWHPRNTCLAVGGTKASFVKFSARDIFEFAKVSQYHIHWIIFKFGRDH